jgi:hypothetical protein
MFAVVLVCGLRLQHSHHFEMLQMFVSQPFIKWLWPAYVTNST